MGFRIAIGGIAHETDTFSTLPTRTEDFDPVEWADLMGPAYWEALQQRNVTLAPIHMAHACPGGPVTQAAFEALLERLLQGLRAAMPLDGVLLTLHGAMEVTGIGDGETAILEAVRKVLGPEVLIATTLDLHANLAPRVVALSDLIVAYRTAPHRDMQQTQQRGMDLLLQCLREGLRPHCHVVKLPLLVAGEAAVTDGEPARSLYARLPAIDDAPGVLVSSILIGCAWTDSPHTAMTVVLAGTDAARMRSEAEDLAAAIWTARAQFAIQSPTAPLGEAIAMALAREERPVFVSDLGDNTTAGGAGDLPLVLAELLEKGAENTLVAGIADAEAVSRCWAAGEGATLALSLGGKLDAVNGQPLACRAEVLRLVPAAAGIPRQALVRCQGVDVVLQTHRRAFTEAAHFSSMGLDPSAYRLVVVKEGYLFPELAAMGGYHVMAMTPGFADQRLERLPYQRLRRPIYPLDKDAAREAWS